MCERREWLVGNWEVSDDSSSIVLEIGLDLLGFKVRAWDPTDGEEIVVTRIHWDGERLSFETFVPSSDWRTRNVLRPISPGEFEQELTIWERWTRVGPRRLSE